MAHDCTKCRYFVICESWRQFFYKVTGRRCDEFKEAMRDEVQSEQTEG